MTLPANSHPMDPRLHPDDARRLCRQAAKKNITIYLRQSPNRCTGALASLSHWVRERVKEPNFKSAPSLAAQMLNEGGGVQKIAKSIAASRGVAAPPV